jgi:hypothetical protein
MSLATLEIAVEDGELTVTLFIDNKIVTVLYLFHLPFEKQSKL